MQKRRVKETKNRSNKWKPQNKVVDLNANISVITLNLNGLTVPHKNQS